MSKGLMIDVGGNYESDADRLMADPRVEEIYERNSTEFDIIYGFLIDASNGYDAAAAWYLAGGDVEKAKAVLGKSQGIDEKLRELCEDYEEQVEVLVQFRQAAAKLKLVSERPSDELAAVIRGVINTPDMRTTIMRYFQTPIFSRMPTSDGVDWAKEQEALIVGHIADTFASAHLKKYNLTPEEANAFHSLFETPNAVDALAYVCLETKLQ